MRAAMTELLLEAEGILPENPLQGKSIHHLIGQMRSLMSDLCNSGKERNEVSALGKCGVRPSGK
jgi:hypothetical protein